MMGLTDIAEHLTRRQRYTPTPAIKGVCGFPVPSGLLATLQYRCRCGTIALPALSKRTV